MKAMIFAAGLGTRLKPLTDSMPKALARVANKPLLQHTIETLKAAGFDEIIINIHHFGEQIIDFVQAHNAFGIRIEFSDEREQLLNTGGGIKKAARFFDDGKPFLIHNVDIFSNVDLRQLYTTHLNNKAAATLVVSERATTRYLLFDEKATLCGWINKKTGETKSHIPDFNPASYKEYAFSGIHVLSPSNFKHMHKFPDKFSIIDFYLAISREETIKAYVLKNLSVVDIGKIDTLKKLNKTIDF